MQMFISCDWGTTALRLRVVNTSSAAVLQEVTNQQGIAHVFSMWQQANRLPGERLAFYQSFLTKGIKELEAKLSGPLQNVPVMVSGMASANIGMVSLPYKNVPFNANASDLLVEKIEATSHCNHIIYLVSGAQTNNDVMRGEETQLAGAFNGGTHEQLYIFPGTHSKHVYVKEGKVADFKTYMTGEYFALLSQKSVLANSVEQNNDLSESNIRAFLNGVRKSAHDGLLHNSFLIRTNHLFNKLSKAENYFYLSGLLIGTELQEISKTDIPIVIVGSNLLNSLYGLALTHAGITNFTSKNAGEAIVLGHQKVFARVRE